MTPPVKPELTLEGYLASEAGDAIAKGADPQTVTNRLGEYVRHLRANPAMTSQANAAIQQGADPVAVAHRYTAIAAQSPEPGVFSRAWDQIKGIASQAVEHPLDTVSSLVTAPINSAANAVAPTTAGAARLNADPQFQARMAARFGQPVTVQGVTPQEKAMGAVQTVANIALPGIASRVAAPFERAGFSGLGNTLGTAAAGGTANAAYHPEDPAAAFIAGATLAPTVHGTAKVGSATVEGMKSIGNTVLDAAGRPATSQPITVFGQQIAVLPSAAERAAQLNARVLNASPSTDGLPATSAKPVTPMDVAGTAGVRAVRGLKTAFPSAEGVIKPALQTRADDAANRVITDAMEKMGLTSRDSGVQLVDDLIKQRGDEADAIWPQVFKANPQAIEDARIAKVWNTDSGQRAWREVPGLMSDRFLEPPANVGAFAGEKADLYAKILQMNGGNAEAANAAMRVLGEAPSPPAAQNGPPAMNLQQLHYWAKALDDLGDRGFDRGPGQVGNKYNKAVGAQRLAGLVRQIGKDNVPDYADVSQKYADASDLVRGGELGRELFRMHPDEAAQAMTQLPADAQDIFRRAGFDALAERVENGPADIERGIGKSRDQKRVQLLFPDAAAFNDFKQGLGEEAQMHANEQGALGGSNTSDKLADLANMAGVTLPDIARAAATGRWHRLMGVAIANATRRGMFPAADQLAAERARLMVAGATGDPLERMRALQAMGLLPSSPSALPGGYSAVNAIEDALRLASPRLLTAGSGSPQQNRRP